MQGMQGAMKWVVLGALLLIALAIVLFLLRPGTKEFTLVVRNAPSGTTILVDEVALGIPDETGAIKISHLKIGEHKITLSSDNLQRTVTSNGELVEISGPKPSLPKEITYDDTTMVLVEAGPFTMGDNSIPNASPAHEENPESFYIDKYEVSNERYKKFCDATNRPYPAPSFDPNYFKKSKFPVIGISYEDAEAFAKWMDKQLPTEKEWEKAASWDPVKSVKRKYSWKDGETPAAINVNTTSFQPVDSATGDLSAYGVVHMIGNASEWVNGLFLPYPGNQASDPNFNQGIRVVRGGAYENKLQDVPAAARFLDPKIDGSPDKENWLVSFRCVILTSNQNPKLRQAIAKASN